MTQLSKSTAHRPFRRPSFTAVFTVVFTAAKLPVRASSVDECENDSAISSCIAWEWLWFIKKIDTRSYLR